MCESLVWLSTWCSSVNTIAGTFFLSALACEKPRSSLARKSGRLRCVRPQQPPRAALPISTMLKVYALVSRYPSCEEIMLTLPKRLGEGIPNLFIQPDYRHFACAHFTSTRFTPAFCASPRDQISSPVSPSAQNTEYSAESGSTSDPRRWLSRRLKPFGHLAPVSDRWKSEGIPCSLHTEQFIASSEAVMPVLKCLVSCYAPSLQTQNLTQLLAATTQLHRQVPLELREPRWL